MPKINGETTMIYHDILHLSHDNRIFYGKKAYKHKAISLSGLATLSGVSISQARNMFPKNVAMYCNDMKAELDSFVMGEKLHQVNLIDCNGVWVSECSEWQGEHGNISNDPDFLSDLKGYVYDSFMFGNPIFEKDTFWIKTELNEVDDMSRFLSVVLNTNWS